MTRRRRRRDPAAHLRGNILDPRPGEEHLAGMNLLEYAMLTPRQRQAPIGPICCCPPPEACRLGGQRPMLRWAAHDRLEPACGQCQKPLQRGIHKRRPALHVMGLAALPLSALDLEDLLAAGLLLEYPPRPEPPERPSPCSLPSTLLPDGEEFEPGAWEPEVAEAMRLLAAEPDLAALADPADLARLVETGADFTDGAEQG